MQQTLTVKLQILPNANEQTLLKQTMAAYIAGCNFVSAHIYNTHDLSQNLLNKTLYRDLRVKFDLGAQMAQSAIRAVIASYKTILANKQPWTQVKYKRGFYDLVWNRDYLLRGDYFSINTLQGRIKLKFHKEGLEQYFDGKSKFGSATVICRKNKFFLCVSVTREVPDTLPICNVVGIDRGINFIVATYDSKGKCGFVSGRAIKKKRAAFKHTRKSLQRVRTKSARRRLKQIGQRENRWMADINHQVSKALVTNNPQGTLFVIEDLTGIRNVTETVYIRNRYVQVSWAYFDLAQKLKYKAIRAGSQVIEVDPAYTSQTCPKCGFVHKGNRDKHKHIFKCKTCGYQSNDDRIAAMNLYFKGIQYHSTVTNE